MSQELKPCPFCGNEAHFVDDLIIVYASCTNCGATGAHSSYKSGAADAWNRRAALSATQPAQAAQSEPFGFIHHYVAHDSHGGIIDSTWEADGCDDEMPHPTHPLKWGWERSEPFYTHPTPAQPAPVVPEGWKLVPVEPTEEMLDAVVTTMDEAVHGKNADVQYREDWAAMLAAAPTPPAQAAADANGSA